MRWVSMDAISNMLFQNWSGILRTLLVGALAYIGLVAMLRISGKRTLAQLNAFDLVVTVAIGSVLASILLSESVALAEGLTAFALLIGLQWIVAWSSVRSERFAGLVRSEASLLMRNGEIQHAALRRERVTETELMTVIRASSVPDPNDVTAVILETDGSFSVVAQAEEERVPYATAGIGGADRATGPQNP
ncbi:DUF421 domain-containing protein [Wenxinia saemankumensis]|uniref:DUF421 domain-containing protein n=1 Tax=Wenxinia saemankumensis TaxID=1447782 RepID=A0A1M6ET79_9RHOB|nr:YetF domain-containing protein [Wenxinia saemankumensis]SHI88560.1 Protein of unknown function [Wenxinia saemankumensis]